MKKALASLTLAAALTISTLSAFERFGGSFNTHAGNIEIGAVANPNPDPTPTPTPTAPSEDGNIEIGARSLYAWVDLAVTMLTALL
ncbi:MAG: hypothetical protein M3416_03780 [Acidobacteriota bacterium]|nr:hypothetical protein [Acidobacteriota bacterium]